MAKDNGQASFLDKFAEVSAKVGNQVHFEEPARCICNCQPNLHFWLVLQY